MLTDTLYDFTTFNNASIYVNYNYSYKFKVNSSITNYVPGLFLYWYIYFYSFVDGPDEDRLNRKLGTLKRNKKLRPAFHASFLSRIYIYNVKIKGSASVHKMNRTQGR